MLLVLCGFCKSHLNPDERDTAVTLEGGDGRATIACKRCQKIAKKVKYDYNKFFTKINKGKVKD